MRRPSWIGIALLAGGLAQAGPPTDNQIRTSLNYVRRGMAVLERGDTARAKKDFVRALETIPFLPEANVGMGLIAMRERRFEDALTMYDRAEAGYAEMTVYRARLAADRYAASRGVLDESRSEMHQLEALAQRADAHGTHAGGLGRAPAPAGALFREETAARRRANDLERTQAPSAGPTAEPPAELRFHQGNALFNLKRADEAISRWEQGAATDPNFALIQNNLAVAYWTRGRLDEAQAAFARAEGLGFKVNPSFRADLEKAIQVRAVAGR